MGRKFVNFYEEIKKLYLSFCSSESNKKVFLESVNLNKQMMRLPWNEKK